MNDHPRVSVIIPVREDPRLAQCLDAVQCQTYPADRVEIVVADNGHTSSVPDMLRDRPSVIYVAEPAGGSYAARNVGVIASSGEILAFTDADCLPEPDWLMESVTAIVSGADVVAGHVTVFARDNHRPHPVEAYELVHAFPQRTYVSRAGASVTANMTTTRAVFDTVGPFRHELYSGADIEWSQRAASHGMHTEYCRTAVVRHPARASYRALNSKLRRVIVGRHERDMLDGGSARAPWPSPALFVPPLGALRRARTPQLSSARAKAALIAGEFFHRYAGAWQTLGLAVRSRRRRVPGPPPR